MNKHLCPTCGGKKSARSKQCRTCHCRSIAHLGWAATAKKYGVKVAVKHLRRHLLANPSSLEQRVIGALDLMIATYRREEWFEVGEDEQTSQVYLIDFVVEIDGHMIAIEVDGDYCHQFHKERDARKTVAIEAAGMKLIRLSDVMVNSPTLVNDLQAQLQVA